MMADQPVLKLALDRYDRHFPFFDGTVGTLPGFELQILQVGQSERCRDGSGRHERMFHGLEFDICEFGLSPYIMMLAENPHPDLIALPIFPRRLFSQSQIFVSEDSSLSSVADLRGKKIAVRSFHTTLSVLAMGDLATHYGVPWQEIIWCPTKAEMFNQRPSTGLQLDPLPDGTKLTEALATGIVDAVIMPHLPKGMLDPDAGVRRLLAECRAEEERYFRDRGGFPIMHLVVARRALLEEAPHLARQIMELFAQAQSISASYWDDPNWSKLAWGRHAFEDERNRLGDAWPNGLEPNRRTLETFIGYLADLELIPHRMSCETLFHVSALDIEPAQ